MEFIIAEGLEPGDRLPAERTLSERLKVGRFPAIREAMQVLRATGVVEASTTGMTVGGGGATLLTRPLSWGLLMNVRGGQEEFVDARRVIEVGLAGMAAARATRQDLGAIKSGLAEMGASKRSVEAFAESDLTFHLAVAKAAHNFLLFHVVDTLQHVIRTWIEQVAANRKGEESNWIDEHRRVFVAIRDGRVEEAEAAMNVHLAAAGVRLVEVVHDAQTRHPR